MSILMRQVHAPCIYGELSGDDDARQRHCSAVLQVLYDACINCIVLVDDQRALLKQTRDLVSRWPGPQRKRAEELLKQLRRRRRMVLVPLPKEREVTSHGGGCALASALADVYKPDALIQTAHCQQCGDLRPNGVTLQGYNTSAFFDERRSSERLELQRGEWTRTQVELAVWRPLFRYAAHVHIVDRYIGRSVEAENGIASVDRAYADTLFWIASEFARSAGRRTEDFKITCGVKEDDLSPVDYQAAVTALRGFGKELETALTCPVTMNVKKERKGHELPHDRFIFTDQVSLQVSPGFDFLRHDGYAMVIFTHHRDRTAIEDDVDAVTDAD